MRMLAVLLVLPATIARADYVDPDPLPTTIDPVPPAPQPIQPVDAEAFSSPTAAPHWMVEGGFGVRVGTARLDSHSAGVVVPGHLDAGVRHGAIFLYGEYQLSGISYPGGFLSGAPLRLQTGSADGLQHRLGAQARYTIGRIDDEDDEWFDLWVEAGAGIERIQWDAGGTWTRPDVVLGLGTSLLGWGHHRHGGISLGLRITLARRNDVANAPDACGGPCDAPTPPTGWDRSFLFDATVMFGR